MRNLLIVALLLIAATGTASAGELCILTGSHFYKLEYTPTDGGVYLVTGYVVALTDRPGLHGSAFVRANGSIVMAFTTVWPFATGKYLDPVGSVVLTFPDTTLLGGTADITYHGASIPPRSFTSQVTVAPCLFAPFEQPGRWKGENEK